MNGTMDVVQQFISQLKHDALKKHIHTPDSHPEKLQNAIKSYAQNVKKEDVQFFIDSTYWQEGIEGALFTKERIYMGNEEDRWDYDITQIELSEAYYNPLISDIMIKDLEDDDNYDELYLPVLLDTHDIEESSTHVLFNFLTEYVAQCKALQKTVSPKPQPALKQEEPVVEKKAVVSLASQLSAVAKQKELVERVAEITTEVAKPIQKQQLVKQVQKEPKPKAVKQQPQPQAAPNFETRINKAFQIKSDPLDFAGRLYYYANVNDSKVSKKFNNVLSSYAKECVSNSETPIVLFDNTVFGNAKDGFCLTNKAIYWHNIFSHNVRIPYEEVRTIEVKKKDFYFNGAELNAETFDKKNIIQFSEVLEKIFTIPVKQM